MGDLIRTGAELAEACAAARAEGILSLDTEFVWAKTYRPRLGLVQVGCRACCSAVDVTAGFDPGPLGELVADESVVKIVHDARQDLILVRGYTRAAPRNIFDTQLAAAFAGFQRGTGLQKLLLETIGVDLPKTETRTDWIHRPLTGEQIRYALDDVRYLPELRDWLLAKAESYGTRAWLEEEVRNFEGALQYDEPEPQDAWRRIKTGKARLDGRGLAALRAVAAVREETARKWNLPRMWLGDDRSLVEMALKMNAGRFVHRLRGSQADTMRSLYTIALKRASGLPEAEWPEDPRRQRYCIDQVRESADAALEWLAGRAESLHIDASIIANRATVEAFVDDVSDEANPLSAGWRYEAAGREMAGLFGVD